jgi:hypothetical protein
MAERDTRFDAGIKRLALKLILAYDEVEPTPPICEVLRRELGPLLESAREAAEFIRNDEAYSAFKKELAKWQK